MQITDIKSVSKTKFKVYLDGQFAFTLYKGELFRYRIQEDGELSLTYRLDICNLHLLFHIFSRTLV